MAVDLISVTLRALSYVALFQAVGLVFFLTLFGRELTEAHAQLRRAVFVTSSPGMLLFLAELALEAPRMAGDFSGLRDTELQRLAWTSGSGVSALMQAAGLL